MTFHRFITCKLKHETTPCIAGKLIRSAAPTAHTYQMTPIFLPSLQVLTSPAQNPPKQQEALVGLGLKKEAGTVTWSSL